MIRVMKFSRLKRLSKMVADCINQIVFKLNISTGNYLEVPIVELNEIGEKVCTFKEKNVEHFEFIKTLGFLARGSYEVEYPEINLWKINNAMTFYGSDFIVTDNGKATWPKYFYYNYSKNIPTDYYLVGEKDGIITYRTPKKVLSVDNAFSMLGVFDRFWAHAIVEYYPKLAVLEKAINHSNNKITVLVPEYKDKQLNQVMYDQLNKYDVEILVVHKDEAIKCNTLYFMPRPTIFTDHETSVTPGEQIIPKACIDFVKENMVRPYVKDIIIEEKYRKIFLPRRGGLGKGIINCDEIENIFKERGFYFVEPHKVSFEEKMKIFQSAEIIVGPFGSAFTNLFFCRPGTKVLMFNNFQRVFDYYFSAAQQYFGVEISFLIGRDDKNASNMSHCSYYLSPEIVLEAAITAGVIDE